MIKFEINKTYFIKKRKTIKSYFVTGRKVISGKRTPFEFLYYKDDNGKCLQSKIFNDLETELIFPKGSTNQHYILFAKNSC